MKKILLLLALLISVSAVIITSCDKSENELPSPVKSEQLYKTTRPNEVNALAFNNVDCTDSIIPTPISSFTALYVDGGLVVVRYQSSTPCYSDFKVTPIYVRGSAEYRLDSLSANTGGSQTWRFDKQQLINSATALGARAGSQIKYKFGVITINNTLTSTEVKSGSVNIR